MKIINDITYYKDLKLDIYLPDATCFPTVIYFHGGGMERGSKECCKKYASYLAEHGIAFVSANYSLYPNTKYPEYIEESAECVNWVYQNMKNYGKCENFYIGGSSAGAYISMMLCFDERYLKKHNIDKVKGYIHNAGQPTAHYNVLHYSDTDSRRVIVDERAPLYYVGTTNLDQSMLILYSENDMENRAEQTRLLISTLKHFKYTNIQSYMFKNMTHCEQDSACYDDGVIKLAKAIYDYVTEQENK